MSHSELITRLNDAINEYSFKKSLEEDWEFGDGYLLAMTIYFEFRELGLYDKDWYRIRYSNSCS